MCGLAGFCDFTNKTTAESLQQATTVLRHRGPDCGKTERYHFPDATVGFGHRRLSILDLTDHATQPMATEDGKVVVIFNGEIYNYLELKKDLESKGIPFSTQSDTEVILKSYQCYGIQAIERFIGMFTFALLDNEKQELYVIRDRVGVKPLYYYNKDGVLLFASELKSLNQFNTFKKDVNLTGVSLFFKYGYIPGPHTIFQNTYKLTPGTYLKVDLQSRSISKSVYWSILDYYNKPSFSISENEALEEIEKLLHSAFQYRMVSDVPVGVFLSGGYDSSAVAGILQKNNPQKIKTFTIGFNEQKFNEAPFAKSVANYLGTEHYEHYCSTKEAQEIIPVLPDIYDEPFGDSSAIPTLLVSRFAREHITVALSADGGDELFAGYNRYDQMSKLRSTMLRLPDALKKPLGELVQAFPYGSLPGLKNNANRFSKLGEILQTSTIEEASDALSQHFTNRQLTSLLTQNCVKTRLSGEFGKVSNPDFINLLLALDSTTYLPDDILVKVDRATMSVGLEGREPFLDHRLIEFAAQLPSSFKYKNGEKKAILKRITHKYVPKALLDRPKQGFGIPLKDWLRTDLKHLVTENISSVQLRSHGLINEEFALQARDRFLAGQNGEETKVWLLLMFQMWWSRWM
jgi:asparagine synthase (glutamine-hydrolysing)